MIKIKIILFLSLICASNFGCAQKGTYQSLEEAIREPTNVKVLILNDKGIIKLPDEIVRMKKLKKVSLSYNKGLDINDLIEKLSKLPNLKELDISFCEITELPKEINSLKQLRKLKLGANKLTSLPDQIGELSNLQELIFSQFPDNDFRSFSLEEKKKIITLLPNCKVLLVDYFGSVHGNNRLGQKEIRVTLDNVNSFQP